METCKNCLHYDICTFHVTGNENEKCTHYTPTADVVPKSEVDRLQEEVNRYKRYFFRHDYDEMIAEVLDELDRFINSNCIEIKDERGIKGYVTSGVHFAIAELKKKYTEGEK
jgi:protein associated with RNAse G/E